MIRNALTILRPQSRRCGLFVLNANRAIHPPAFVPFLSKYDYKRGQK
ncbi:hypothetical protein HMPREF1581_00403 [Gardnerella vaginalis JCP8108]|uniref:Uncharacterized protein n=1 Tax=Gardnerella vaginalis JCP8108 TaxID=1261066 RepID=S4GTU5_GARVA|nr:hypothetical protein HMPREF1581_00403 [Gardnerella vaginalis JCP8108]